MTMALANIDRADPPLTHFWIDGAQKRRHISLTTRDSRHTWCGVPVSQLDEDKDGKSPLNADTLCIECMGNGPTFDGVYEVTGGELIMSIAEVGLEDVRVPDPVWRLVRIEGLPPRVAVARRLGLERASFAFQIAWRQGVGER